MTSTTTSTIDPSTPPLHPVFDPAAQSQPESEHLRQLIESLKLQPHVEGGYFVETDRDTLRVPNPFTPKSTIPGLELSASTRSASTSIHYLLAPQSPLGAFHRNRGRTVHTLHRGRGRYVIIHADEVASGSCPGGYGGGASDLLSEKERWTGKRARVETFVVGQNVLAGEKLQWVVEGGKYKASFLLPDNAEGGEESEGLLISETVVPGFEFEDHDFMRMERLEALVGEEQAEEMRWMIRKE